MSDPERTLRQRLVAEIGDAGQARLAQASATVTDRGLAGEVQARYLAGAGFGALRVATERQAELALQVDPQAHVVVAAGAAMAPSNAHERSDSAAQAVLDGSMRALSQIREALAVSRKLAPITLGKGGA